jgi:hypothetical protein
MNNPIIDEVRAARASIAAEHGYDREKILAWARAEQAAIKNMNPSDVDFHAVAGGAAGGGPVHNEHAGAGRACGEHEMLRNAGGGGVRRTVNLHQQPLWQRDVATGQEQ